MSDSTTRAPDLDAIRRRRAGCTETPWRQVFGQSSYPATWPTTEVRSEDAFVCDTYDRVHGEGKGAIEDEIRNAEFIAHAPEDIDALLAENARLTAERDALARGEDMPSLDAIRAHGGVWVVTDGSTATTLSLRVDATTVYAVDACGCDLRYDAERFAELHAGCRWWRVRSDGTLAAGLTGDDGAR